MTGFICHDDYYDRLKRLSDEEVGHLFRQLMLYHAGREDEMTDFIDSEGIAFDFIKDDIDRAEAKAKETSETNRLNGLRGGRPRKQEEPEETEKNRLKPAETDRNPTKAYKDKDKDKDIDIDIKENPLKGVKEKPARFSPPSVEEVRAYCQERGNKVDPEQFVAFYESKGWKIGNTPMKSWKASVITWEKRETTRAAPVKKVIAQQYEQRDYSGVQDELMEQQDREMEEYLRKEREKGASNNAESNSTADVLPDDSEWLFNGTG